MRKTIWLLIVAVVGGGIWFGWRMVGSTRQTAGAVAVPAAAPSAAAEGTGTLVVHTTPDNTEVEVAGAGARSGPVATYKALKAGRYAISASSFGYLTWRGEADVKAGPDTAVEAKLERAYGMLQLEIRPANLGYALNGPGYSTEGVTSNRPLRVPVGHYTLTIFGGSSLGVLREQPVDVKADQNVVAQADVQSDIDRALAPSVDKAVLNNARQLAAASDQYFLENGVSIADLQHIVGPTNYVKALNQIARETYPTYFTQGVTLTVTGIAGARTITYAP